MDIVLGVSLAPTTVRLVLVEGQDADGVTVEEGEFEFAPTKGAATSAGSDQVIEAIIGTREGAAEGGYELASTGVTWTDPAAVGGLREAIASHDVGRVMLVSPLLAAAALAQTVGLSLGYEHIAMLFVERASATLAVIDVADGSIVDLHRRQLVGGTAAEPAAMVAGLDAPTSRAGGVFVVGCGGGPGSDVAAIKAALEAATALEVTVPEEPDTALARGAALASANAPLFVSSTAALAYSLDPGTGEVSPRALGPTYLDVSGNAAPDTGALAYSALDEAADEAPHETRRRWPSVLVGGALAGIVAVAAGAVVVSLTSDAHPAPPRQPTPHAAAPADRMAPPEAQPPAPSAPPAAPPPAVAAPPPAPEVEVPSAPSAPPVPPAPPPVASPAPQIAVNEAPAPPRRAPTPRAQESVPPPVQQAPPPVQQAPPPVQQAPALPPMTMYLHLPFVTVPIPINPPPLPPPAP